MTWYLDTQKKCSNHLSPGECCHFQLPVFPLLWQHVSTPLHPGQVSWLKGIWGTIWRSVLAPKNGRKPFFSPKSIGPLIGFSKRSYGKHLGWEVIENLFPSHTPGYILSLHSRKKIFCSWRSFKSLSCVWRLAASCQPFILVRCFFGGCLYSIL